MKAVKGNKQYTIDESQKKHYQNSGFDILGDNGEILAYGRGKTVSYDEYKALEEQLAKVKAEKDSLAEQLDSVRGEQSNDAEKQKKAGK